MNVYKLSSKAEWNQKIKNPNNSILTNGWTDGLHYPNNMHFLTRRLHCLPILEGNQTDIVSCREKCFKLQKVIIIWSENNEQVWKDVQQHKYLTPSPQMFKKRGFTTNTSPTLAVIHHLTSSYSLRRQPHFTAS